MAINTWTGVTDTNYNTATNWDLGHKPSAGESVAFSGSGNCVMNEATAILEAWDMTGYTGILSSTGNIRIDNTADAVCLFAGGTHTWSGQLLLNPASTKTLSLTSAGKLGACTALTINGAGTVVLVDGLTLPTATTFTRTAGILKIDGASDNSGLTHSWGNFSAGGTYAIYFGNSTMTLTGNLLSFSGTPNHYQGTSTIIMSGTGATIQGSSLTFYDMRMTGAAIATLSAGYTFTNFTRTGTASQNCLLNLYSGQTVNGSLILNGNSAINRLMVQSTSTGIARTITLGASATCASVSNYVDMQDITMSGGAANERDFQTNSKSAGDCGGNTDITFTAEAEQTWSGVTGNWSTSGLWTSRVPLPQDNVVIPNPGAASRILTADMPRLGKDITVTNTSAANKPTLALTNQANTIYGSLTLVSSTYMTFSHNKALTFAGRSNAECYTIVQSLGADIVIAKPNAELILQDAFATTGKFTLSYGDSTAIGNVTAYGFTTSAGTTLDMGSGSWTPNSNNFSTVYNFLGSVDGSNATLYWNSAAVNPGSMVLGANTYKDIIITPSSQYVNFSGAFTFANMTMASAGAKTVKFTTPTSYTMTGTDFFTGNSTAPTTTAIISGDTLNGNFETATGNDFANWTEVVSGSSIVTAETTDVHSGSKCVKFTIDGSSSLAQTTQTVLTVGRYYKATYWAKADSATNAVVGDSNAVTNQILTSTWTQYTTYFIATTTSFILKRGTASTANRTIYFDDVELTEYVGLLIIPTDFNSTFTINKITGTIVTDNIYLQDCTASGGLTAAYAGSHSIDGSGNTGWTFSGLPSSATAFLLIQLSNFVRQTQAASPMGGYNL